MATNASVSVRIDFPQPPMTASGASRQPSTTSTTARTVHQLGPDPGVAQPLQWARPVAGSPTVHAAPRFPPPAWPGAPADSRPVDRHSSLRHLSTLARRARWRPHLQFAVCKSAWPGSEPAAPFVGCHRRAPSCWRSPEAAISPGGSKRRSHDQRRSGITLEG